MCGKSREVAVRERAATEYNDKCRKPRRTEFRHRFTQTDTDSEGEPTKAGTGFFGSTECCIYLCKSVFIWGEHRFVI